MASGVELRALAAADRLGRHVGALAEEGQDRLALRLTLGAQVQRARARGVVGSNDLVELHWLARGQAAAASVGLLEVLDPLGLPVRSGTAFVVAPGLVLTNHHVLPSDHLAASARLRLGHELAADGTLQVGTTLAVDPDVLYLSDDALDFALVAVQGTCPPPLPVSLEAPDADAPLVVVQHPGGAPKQLAVGLARALAEVEGFLHYGTDTRRGSSGAPVFDLSWRVVALHHEAVPRVDGEGHILALDGERWHEAMGADQMAVLANEGLLMGALADHLVRRRPSLSMRSRQQVETLLSGWGR